MALTLAQMEARTDLLASRMALLATTEQVANLADLVTGWKNDHYDHIVNLHAKDTAFETRLNDLEVRVQALETP